ncbi:hypothetical protein OQA88_12837 [Cercophora sp. LCS_1]
MENVNNNNTTIISTGNSTSTVTVVDLKRSLIPPKWEESVRNVSINECREAAMSLAHAFAADDYAKYLVDPGDAADGVAMSPEGKWKLHVDLMTYSVASHCLSAMATTIGPDYDSVALWIPPGMSLDGWWTLLRSGMWRLYFTLSAEGRKRLFEEIIPLLHDTKASVLGDRDADAWYLVYLGTKPNSQGRGYAKRLLEDTIQKADAENRPMYLESSSPANNVYYAKFGFEVKREISLKRGDNPVRLSVMVREPGAARKKAAVPATGSAHNHHAALGVVTGRAGSVPIVGVTKRAAMSAFHVTPGGGNGVKIG